MEVSHGKVSMFALPWRSVLILCVLLCSCAWKHSLGSVYRVKRWPQWLRAHATLLGLEFSSWHLSWATHNQPELQLHGIWCSSGLYMHTWGRHTNKDKSFLKQCYFYNQNTFKKCLSKAAFRKPSYVIVQHGLKQRSSGVDSKTKSNTPQMLLQ